MTNAPLAQLFAHSADVLALLGEDSFRILAYRKVARTLEELPQDIATLAANDQLDSIPGIGESSARKIREYLRTGHIAELEDHWTQVPTGVLDIMKIPSVGPKTAALFWHEANVTSVEQLLAKIDDGSLLNLPGVGAKKLDKIKQNLAFLATSSGRIPLGKALPIAQTIVAHLLSLPGVENAQYCGSLRRAKETIGDIDIAVAADDAHASALITAFTQHPLVQQIINAGTTKASVRANVGTDSIQVDLRIVPPESFGAAVQYFTGSKEHNVRLREIAVKQGYKLNEWGLFKMDHGNEVMVAGRTEKDIYHTLGFACLPPEMREDTGELDLAADLYKSQSKTKTKSKIENRKSKIDIVFDFQPLELHDLHGDLHMHTTASDGSRTLEDMVAECKRRGYLYLAITDHSKSEIQANGLRVDRLLEHIKAIHAVAKEAAKSGLLVLAGSEVDLLADGSLDYEDDILAQLDWVIASPHSALSQDSELATQRLVRACANPHVHVIGHPTGRLIPDRRGLEPDMKRVVYAAARHGVALELNANYHRLDLRDTHLRLCREANVPVCINSDAHSFDDLDQLPYGILTARRGWLQKDHILNALPLPAFKKWLHSRKDNASW